MALVIPGSRNGFLINLTPQVIAYTRDEKEFKINKYAEFVETKKPDGAYTKIGRDQQIRIDNINRSHWAPGADRPKGDWNKQVFEHVAFSTKRYHEPWELDYMTIDTFDSFDVKLAHMQLVVSQAMTSMTYRFLNLMTTSANWGGVHVKTAHQWSGISSPNGFWHKASADEASPSFNAIEKTLHGVMSAIHMDTNGKVTPSKLRMIINHNTAQKIKSSGEWSAYMKGSPDALPQLRDPGNINMAWGLTERFKGLVEIVVEDGMYLEAQRNSDESEVATASRKPLMPDNMALICTQIGGVDGTYGAPSFSTGQIFFYPKPLKGARIEDGEGGRLVTTAIPDDLNERIVGGATCMTAEVLAAPHSGALITNLFS